MNFITAILIFSVATQIDAKIYTKCEFARTMRSAGFSMESLPDWVCLVQHESNFNSGVINYHNSDGSWDWGIFQYVLVIFCICCFNVNFLESMTVIGVDVAILETNAIWIAIVSLIIL